MSQDNTRVDLPKEDKIPKLYNPYTTLDEKFGNIGSHYFQDKEDVVADKARELAYQGLFGDESENTNLMTGAVPFADAAIKLSEGKQPGILDIVGDLKVPAMAMIPIAKWGKGVKKGERIGKNARNIEKAKDANYYSTFYHRTEKTNVPSIMERGLTTNNKNYGINTSDAFSYAPVNWLSARNDQIPVLRFAMENQPQDVSLLQIKIPKNKMKEMDWLTTDTGNRHGKFVKVENGEPIVFREGGDYRIAVTPNDIPPDYLKEIDNVIRPYEEKKALLGQPSDEDVAPIYIQKTQDALGRKGYDQTEKANPNHYDWDEFDKANQASAFSLMSDKGVLKELKDEAENIKDERLRKLGLLEDTPAGKQFSQSTDESIETLLDDYNSGFEEVKNPYDLAMAFKNLSENVGGRAYVGHISRGDMLLEEPSEAFNLANKMFNKDGIRGEDLLMSYPKSVRHYLLKKQNKAGRVNTDLLGESVRFEDLEDDGVLSALRKLNGLDNKDFRELYPRQYINEDTHKYRIPTHINYKGRLFY